MKSLKSKLLMDNELTMTYLKDYPHAFFTMKGTDMLLENSQSLVEDPSGAKSDLRKFRPWKASGLVWSEAQFRAMADAESMPEVERFYLTQHIAGHYSLNVKLTLDGGKTYHWYDLRYRVGSSQRGQIVTEGLLINAERNVNKQQLLQQARNEEEEARSKEIFLNNLGTEIRSPLNIILGFSELLSNPEFQFSEKERKEFCQVIHGNSRVLMTLVNEILDLSRIESGRLQFSMKECQSEDLLETLYLNWVQQVPQGINFRYVEGRKGITVMADKSRIEQVINEFLQNAVKYTTEGEITMGWNYSLKEHKLELYVEDTGCGIPEAQLKQLLDPTHGMAEMQNGTNHLGLAISQVIAKSMNLEIDIQSQEGRGSRFSLYLKEKE